MQITIDTTVDSPQAIRDACALLLTTIGVLQSVGEDPPDAVVDGVRSPIPPPPSAGDSSIPPPPPPLPNAVEVPPPHTFPISGATANGGPTAPIAAAPPVATAAPAIFHSERDSVGLPWDARIHQSGKGRKKDGTWKIKKNCDPTLVQNVVRELTAGAAVAPAQVEVEIPAPPATVSLPPGPASGVPMPAVGVGTTAATVSVASAAAPMPVATVAAVGAVPATGIGPTFRDLVSKFGAATREGRIKPEEVGSICGAAGVPNLMSLAATPELVAKVDALLDARLLQNAT